ncbi:hypothetical protein ACFWAD_28680 [Rhodococcus sp. NPDC059969]|uniref:hypothetical protein n=1 Tax=Rhodococcus sp. NPDC059969 TaxID=3347018 RepID=UPI00366A8BBF
MLLLMSGAVGSSSPPLSWIRAHVPHTRILEHKFDQNRIERGPDRYGRATGSSKLGSLFLGEFTAVETS